MATNNNLYDMWKDFYNQSSNLFDEKIKEEFPSQGVGQILEMNLLFKKMLNEITERYLEQVNMPTRSDLASISSLIVNVDAKVDDLEVLLEESKVNHVSQENFLSELTNVKKDIKGLDEKMSQIITLLTAQNEQRASQSVEKEQNINQKVEKVQNANQKVEKVQNANQKVEKVQNTNQNQNANQKTEKVSQTK